MAAYSDKDYLTDQGVIGETTLANLADKVNKPGQIAAAATLANIAGAIDSADRLIDTYLRRIYDGTLPLTTVPDVIARCSAELACYYLWQSANYADDVNPMADAESRQIGWLRDLSKGLVVLDLEDDSRVPDLGSVSGTNAADREYTPNILKRTF